MKNKFSTLAGLSIIFAVFFAATAFVTDISSTSGKTYTGKAFGGGAVEIQAGAFLNGCVNGNGMSIPFTTNGSGTANVTGLSAGTYTICVENWGTTTFYSNGGSEIIVGVPNNADCTC
jgi:hypothetical protein